MPRHLCHQWNTLPTICLILCYEWWYCIIMTCKRRQARYELRHNISTERRQGWKKLWWLRGMLIGERLSTYWRDQGPTSIVAKLTYLYFIRWRRTISLSQVCHRRVLLWSVSTCYLAQQHQRSWRSSCKAGSSFTLFAIDWHYQKFVPFSASKPMGGSDHLAIIGGPTF
jgi:hypothetical protein